MDRAPDALIGSAAADIAAHRFIDVRIGPAVDTFGGAGGEDKARAYQVYGYTFLARKPG